MHTTRTPPNLCPSCGYAVDAASSATPGEPEAVPSHGSFALCMSCAAVNVFDADLRLRPPHLGEYEAMRFLQHDLFLHMERARERIRQQRARDPIPRRGGNA